MFTGTLIDDLIAAVERTEQAAWPDATFVAGSLVTGSLVTDSLVTDSLVIDPWFASVQENTDYDSKLFEMA